MSIKTTNHTTAFDYAYSMGSHYKKFCELIIKAYLTKAVIRTSIIVPPKTVVAKLSTIKGHDKLINEISVYILKSNITEERLMELSDKEDAKIYTLFRRSFYPIGKNKKNEVTLNSITIKAVKVLEKNTLYESSKKLTPIKYISKEKPKEEKKAGTRKPKKGKKGKYKIKTHIQSIVI